MFVARLGTGITVVCLLFAGAAIAGGDAESAKQKTKKVRSHFFNVSIFNGPGQIQGGLKSSLGPRTRYPQCISVRKLVVRDVTADPSTIVGTGETNHVGGFSVRAPLVEGNRYVVIAKGAKRGRYKCKPARTGKLLAPGSQQTR